MNYVTHIRTIPHKVSAEPLTVDCPFCEGTGTFKFGATLIKGFFVAMTATVVVLFTMLIV